MDTEAVMASGPPSERGGPCSAQTLVGMCPPGPSQAIPSRKAWPT